MPYKKESGLENKLKVVLHEYNILSNGSVYLPLATGCLQTHAQTDALIRENFSFEPIIFYRDDPKKIMEKVRNPSVSAFSASMWNFNLSLDVAKRTREKFPDSLVVFGGPHIPLKTENFFSKYPFIDLTVRSDGEESFLQILKRFLETRERKDFRGIDGISYVGSEGKVFFEKERKLEKDLDVYPTPYVEGGPFDALLHNEEINFHSIVETNRGCPFTCSFCFWGEGIMQSRMRFFSPERIKQIAEWIGKKKIEYVYGADANFGMFERDLEMAQIFVDAKRKHGYPKKFRVCYGKNKPERVLEVAKLLNQEGMAKGITLSRQSNDHETLKNVGRSNISLRSYDTLQKKYSEAGISTYTEMILGLPGETYDSFLGGLEDILRGNRIGQLYVYHCQVLPNTELADSSYQKKHGIVTKNFPLQEVHSIVRGEDSVEEKEEIIVYTKSMPPEDWRKSAVNAWIAQTFHGLQLGLHVSNYLWDRHKIGYMELYEHIAQNKIDSGKAPELKKEVLHLHDLAEKIQKGRTRAEVVPEFGDVSWEPEEASYLRFSRDFSVFYTEFEKAVEGFLEKKEIEFNKEELKEVFLYQSLLVPKIARREKIPVEFQYNVPEYFEKLFSDKKTPIKKTRQKLKIKEKIDFKGDLEKYARETLLWGRRSNELLCKSEWVQK